MNNLNEEINYIKYLLSYQKGKVLSEQKLILEQATKADYDQIANSLDESYKTVFEKYSFTGITFFGIDSKNDLISDYTGTPTVVGLKLPFEAESMDGKFNYTYMTCSPQQIKSSKTRGVIYSVVDPINNGTNSGILASLYLEKAIKRDKITKVTEAIENKYKSQYFNTSKSIFNEACKLIKSKSEGNDVTKDLEKIYTVNNPKTTTTAQQQTTTTQTTTQTKNTPIEQIGTNRYKSPLFTVTEIPQYKKWIVEGFCSLPTGSADAGTFDELLIEKIKEAVNNSKDPKLQANKEYITLTFAEVRGTASNSWGGKEIAYDGEFDGYNWRVIKETKSSITDENYTKNINLAKKRATEILNKIKNELPIADKNGTKIKVNKNLIKSDIKSYSINTGGICDTCGGRDWNTFPIPGQSIYVKLTIKLQGPPPDKLKSVSCLTNAKITVGYFPIDSSINKGQKGHSCDTATFDVYMNDKIISTVDLGNGVLLNDGTQCNDYPDVRVFCQSNIGKFKNLSNTITDNKIGGLRYAEVIISGALAQQINNSSKSGEVSIYIKGKDDSYYRNDRQFSKAKNNPKPNDELTTHSDTPWIMYYPKSDQKQTTIDEAPFGTLNGGDRCGGSTNPCTKNFIMRFNPCGKNEMETVMDSGVGEG